MEKNYLCPKCKSYINIGTKIVLSVHVGETQRGLLLFEKELGDYKVKKNDLINYSEGEMVGFFCPICHENLKSEIHENLARILIVDENNVENDVLFSRISGEMATYKINNDTIEAFGSNKEKYIELIQKSISDPK